MEVLGEHRDKAISSSMIRRLITEDGDWAQFVPGATYRFIREQGIDERIRQTAPRSAD